MARKSRNELTAGVFVLVCIALIVGILIWLSGVELGRGPRAYLIVSVADGNTGLMEGSDVYFGSKLIGKVGRIELTDEGKDFLIEARLGEPMEFYRDATVMTQAPPLGGMANLVFTNIGTSAAGASSPESPIRIQLGASPVIDDMARKIGYGETQRTQVQQTIESISVIAERMKTQAPAMILSANAALADLRATAGKIREVVRALEPQLDPKSAGSLVAKLQASVDDLNKTTSRTDKMVQTVAPEIESTVASVSHAAERVNQYASADLAEVLKSLRASGNELLGTMEDFRKVASTTRDVVTYNRENLDDMLANLTQVSENLKGATREIRRSPWKLLGKPTAEDVRSENIQGAARAFSEGATELDNAVSRLATLAKQANQPVPADDPQLLLIRQKIKDAFANFSKAEQALWEELEK